MNSSIEPSISTSLKTYQRALKVMPGGVSRNAVFRKPHPIYAASGKGCRITDIEGVSRIDFANNMASLIHGHAHPQIIAAVTAQLHKGSAFNLATEIEVDYAEHLFARSPSIEKLRFVNSGTEAVMGCIKAARAYTGRAKIAKVEGAYHGVYDYAEVSQTANPNNWGDASNPASIPVSYGTPTAALNDVVIIPFNDPKRAIEILDQHAQQLACVLVDQLPHRVGLMPASEEFMLALRKWTKKNGSLLVCDEVITYRSTYEGAQGWYKIKPDLTALGKMIGGGFPVGAIAGSSDVMSVMDPLSDRLLFPHSGTYSANPITMVAGLTSMKMFDQAAVTKLNQLAYRAVSQINEAIKIADIEACVTGAGSMFRVHLQANAPTDYRTSFMSAEQSSQTKHLLSHLFDQNILMIDTCTAALSTAMNNSDIDQLSDAMLSGFRKLKA
jgi:glutamate-1-semialdehyde 2,1-aminomutase